MDTKIIKRARQNYLYENYISQNHPLDKVLLDCNEVLVHFKVRVKAVLTEREGSVWLTSLY